MKKEFKVQAISEKVEVLEVNGQYSQACLSNCRRYIWTGNSSAKTKNCKQVLLRDAYSDYSK